MPRLAVVGAVAVLAFGAVALLVVWLAGPTWLETRPSPAEGPAEAPAVARPLPPAPPRDWGAIRQELAERPPPPPPPTIPAVPRPEPPAGSWEAVEPRARASDLGALGPAIGRELNELHDKVGVCFDEDVQARHGGRPPTEVQGFNSLEESGVPVLMLQLETGHDQVRIVDAPVETRGHAGDGLLSCAQHVLRGKSLAVPGASAGTRLRLMYPLIP